MLADSRVQKPKNFLAFSSRLLPPPLHREAEKEMERKFLVLLRRFSLRKEQSYFNIFVCSFLHPHGDRGASSPRFVAALYSANHTQPPTHSPLASLALAASALCVRLVTSRECVVTQRIWIVLGTNKSTCASPTHPMRAQPPAVLKKNYKTAGIAPANTQLSLFGGKEFPHFLRPTTSSR